MSIINYRFIVSNLKPHQDLHQLVKEIQEDDVTETGTPLMIKDKLRKFTKNVN